MSGNPYGAAVSRIFGIVVAGLGAITCLVAVVRSFRSGHALGFGWRNSVMGSGYTSADASQFWFGIVFYLLVGLGLGWLAWRTYRS